MNLLSLESLGEQKYRNKLITVCLLPSWLETKGGKEPHDIFDSTNEKQLLLALFSGVLE